MCDCRLEWRVAPRAVAIDMDPLPVARNFRKLLNPILGDREPIRNPDFTANPFRQRTWIFEYQSSNKLRSDVTNKIGAQKKY